MGFFVRLYVTQTYNVSWASRWVTFGGRCVGEGRGAGEGEVLNAMASCCTVSLLCVAMSFFSWGCCGSYPGMISAWARYQFPHLIYASVSSSAPVQPTLDFPG